MGRDVGGRERWGGESLGGDWDGATSQPWRREEVDIGEQPCIGGKVREPHPAPVLPRHVAWPQERLCQCHCRQILTAESKGEVSRRKSGERNYPNGAGA